MKNTLIYTIGFTNNLPVTDPVYLRETQFGNGFSIKAPELYLCLSLGILHEGLHYKLVAGIIPGNDALPSP